MHTKKLCIIERIDSAFTCIKYMYPLICFCTAFYLISFTRRSDIILFFFQSILELPAFYFDKNDIKHYTKYFFSRQIFTKSKKWKNAVVDFCQKKWETCNYICTSQIPENATFWQCSNFRTAKQLNRKKNSVGQKVTSEKTVYFAKKRKNVFSLFK